MPVSYFVKVAYKCYPKGRDSKYAGTRTETISCDSKSEDSVRNVLHKRNTMEDIEIISIKWE